MVVEWLAVLGIDKADARKYAIGLKRLGVDAAEDMYELDEEDLDAMKKLHRKKVLIKMASRGEN